MGKKEAVELLRRRGAEVDVFAASLMGWDDEVRKLVKQRPQRLSTYMGNYNLSPLGAAVHGGHLSTVKLLVELGADVRADKHRDFYPLMIAVRRGHVDVAEWLLQHGASVEEARSKETGLLHTPPLHQVASVGSPEMAKVLLKHGADADVRDYFGKTPLHDAALTGNRPVAEVLLAAGAKMDAEWRNSSSAYRQYPAVATPLDLAIAKGKKEMVEFLLGKGAGWTFDAAVFLGRTDRVAAMLKEMRKADPEQARFEARYALRDAARHGHGGLARFLLENGYAEADNFAMEPCLICGRPGVLKVLLEAGADPETVFYFRRDNALGLACHHGHTEVVKLLLEHGAKAEARVVKAVLKGEAGEPDLTRDVNVNPLYTAAGGGHLEIVKLLLEAGADVNDGRDYSTALYAAARGGHAEVVKLLLERGASLGPLPRDSDTPIRAAARGGHTEVVRLLLGAGADVNSQHFDRRWTPQGNTPLHEAARFGHEAVAELLLDRGARIDEPNADGMTPLHLAAEKMHWEMIELLLRRGAQPNAFARDGRSPLHVAAMHGDRFAAAILLRHGADPLIADALGKTPIDYAKEKGYRRCAEESRAHHRHLKGDPDSTPK
ncbi:MAG TPA: ankyrin repeat domain-containing protein [Gemmataceae bacterium]